MKKIFNAFLIFMITITTQTKCKEIIPLERPKIGVGVCIIKYGKILLGKRLNSHGHGTWAFPGGHLEFGETVEECALREIAEETGLKICNIRRGPYVEDFFPEENKHYITLVMIADWQAGEPALLEPNKCAEWRWCSLDELPTPLFRTFDNLVKDSMWLKIVADIRNTVGFFY